MADATASSTDAPTTIAAEAESSGLFTTMGTKPNASYATTLTEPDETTTAIGENVTYPPYMGYCENDHYFLASYMKS